MTDVLRNPGKHPRWVLALICVVGALLRLWLAHDNPLTGDEVVLLPHAAGYHGSYYDFITFTVRPVAEYQGMLKYRDAFDAADLVDYFTRHGRGHPPFYYMVVQQVVRFFGGSAFALRMLSIAFSMLSILCIYRIAKVLVDTRAGLIAALVAAVAPFPVYYSMMVRPYPQAALIGLLSTAILLSVWQANRFTPRHPGFYAFALLSALGLYTIYHYALTLIFQFAFLTTARRPDRQHLLRLFIAGGLVILLFAPWLSVMFGDVETIRGDQARHNGPNKSLWAVMKTLVHLNFTYFFSLPKLTHDAPAILIRGIRAGLFFLSFSLVIAGIFRVKPLQRRCALVIGIAAYYAANLLLDLASNTHTLSMEKLQYLPVPFSLLLIAIAVSDRSLNVGRRKIPAWPVLIALLLPGTLHLCSAKPRYEDPYTLPAIKEQVAVHVEQAQSRYLFINNLHSQRQFFSTLAVLPPHGDYLLMLKIYYPDILAQELSDLAAYDTVFLVNFRAGGFEMYLYTPEELQAISAHLERQGFVRRQPTEIDEQTGIDHLLIFTRNNVHPEQP